jgi:hypothetical protein
MKVDGCKLGFSLSLAVAVSITAIGLLAFVGAFIRAGVF